MPTQETETLLKVDNVSLSFSGRQILKNVNIDIKDIVRENMTTGQIVSILGPSGIGKTCLFDIISGLLPIKEGTVVEGQVLIGRAQTRGKVGEIGVVTQEYPLFRHRTVLSNLQLVCNDKAKIEFFLNEFDIMKIKDSYPGAISGGQRQRVAIIQQLLTNGHFMLLDEPFAALDPLATKKLCDVLTRIANLDELNTIVIISHNIAASLSISDTAYILGRDIDKEGNKVDGASVKYIQDLVAMGLTWEENIKRDPKFIDLCNQIDDLFSQL